MSFSDGDGFPYRFKKTVKRLNIPDFTFHDTRHCARTNLRRAGVDTSVAMEMLGHKSEKMSRRYDAIETRDLQDAARRLNQYMGGVMSDGVAKLNRVITPGVAVSTQVPEIPQISA